MAHATAHDPVPCPRPAPLLVFLAVLAASYLALTRLPAAAPLAAPIAPRPHRDDSCAGFYAGAPRAVSASVEEFGAVGDGVTSNTAAFRRAVAALARPAGGARLEVPPGRWLTGSFNLTSRFTLFLHHGAVILGSQDPDEWPLIAPLPSYGRGRERLGPRHISLIHGEGLDDVVITGNNGTIDGQGRVWWELWWNRTLNHTRGHLIELVNSTNILFSNVTLRNSPFWTVHPVYCSNVVMKDLTILAPLNAPNTDGIDPDSSSEVCIEDCYIESGDDLVAVKSGWDQYGISVGKPSSNIVIQRVSGTTPTCSGVGFGSEMSGGISDVLVRDLHVWNSASAVRLKTDIGRGGYITNITIANVTMEKVKVPIRFSRGADDHSDDKYDWSALPRISNVLISVEIRSRKHRSDQRGCLEPRSSDRHSDYTVADLSKSPSGSRSTSRYDDHKRIRRESSEDHNPEKHYSSVHKSKGEEHSTKRHSSCYTEDDYYDKKSNGRGKSGKGKSHHDDSDDRWVATNSDIDSDFERYQRSSSKRSKWRQKDEVHSDADARYERSGMEAKDHKSRRGKRHSEHRQYEDTSHSDTTYSSSDTWSRRSRSSEENVSKQRSRRKIDQSRENP